jgi:hypothetical protein
MGYESTSGQNANPLKYPHLDFLLSHKDHEVLLSPGPFNELYIFPTQHRQKSCTHLPTNVLSVSQLSGLLPWDDGNNLGDLLCHEQDPDIIYAMDEQAYDYYNQGNYGEAENWFRKVLRARKRTASRNSAEIFSTALDIICAAQESGNIVGARKWHKEIHKTILNHFPPTSQLVLKSLQVRGRNSSLAIDHKEAENIFREALQAVMASCGLNMKRQYVSSYIYPGLSLISVNVWRRKKFS